MLRPIALLLFAAAALLFPSAAAAKAKSHTNHGKSHAAPGAVYTETNQPSNQVVVFRRRANGSLAELQRVSTGGAGSLGNAPFGQDFLDANNAVELTGNGRLLFVVNAGDNTISSFRVGSGGRLKRADTKPSGGDHPTSIDTHKGLLYVLNVDSNDISGFRYTSKGKLTPIANSTQPLATPASPPPPLPVPFADQVIFSPHGNVLIVPERTSNNAQGQLDTFAVGSDGRAGPAQGNASNGFIPFALAWDNHNHLVVANGGPPPNFSPGSGSTYSLSGTTLTPIDNKSADADATCWLTVTKDGKYTFMVNQNTKDISRFSISNSGVLTLLGKTSTTGLGTDTAISRNSRYVYVQNVRSVPGTQGSFIDRYRVGSGGQLVHLGVTDVGLPDSASGMAAK
jgi:6-phosphogluconolactonase (cycloisomerase 2 family)